MDELACLVCQLRLLTQVASATGILLMHQLLTSTDDKPLNTEKVSPTTPIGRISGSYDIVSRTIQGHMATMLVIILVLD